MNLFIIKSGFLENANLNHLSFSYNIGLSLSFLKSQFLIWVFFSLNLFVKNILIEFKFRLT